jgi:hypothetical protein
LDESGKTVWEGTERLEPLWRPGELRDYPYESSVFIHTRGEPVDAERVGEAECRSL